MSPTTFSLISLSSHETFFKILKRLPVAERPFYVGKCHHWIHQPNLSAAALNGTGPTLQKWDYLLVTKAVDERDMRFGEVIEKAWSITAEVPSDSLTATHTRSTTPIPPLPAGWSPADPSGLLAAIVPPDLEASLALASIPMGSPTSSTPVGLKDYIRSFGTGPVAMFNLLSYHEGKREQYMKYVAAFMESVGSKYGGEPVFVGFGVHDWSSRLDEGQEDWKWEDTALIWYPSIWHFGKMLDDPSYADVDRKFKQGVIRDNPLICCTEVEVEYED